MIIWGRVTAFFCIINTEVFIVRTSYTDIFLTWPAEAETKSVCITITVWTTAQCNGWSFFAADNSKAPRSLSAIYSTSVYSTVLYMRLFDSEGEPLTYLTCTSAWRRWLYFKLHFKLLPAVYQAEHVWFMNNMSARLISCHSAPASRPHQPRCPLPHAQKKALYPS